MASNATHFSRIREWERGWAQSCRCPAECNLRVALSSFWHSDTRIFQGGSNKLLLTSQLMKAFSFLINTETSSWEWIIHQNTDPFCPEMGLSTWFNLSWSTVLELWVPRWRVAGTIPANPWLQRSRHLSLCLFHWGGSLQMALIVLEGTRASFRETKLMKEKLKMTRNNLKNGFVCRTRHSNKAAFMNLALYVFWNSLVLARREKTFWEEKSADSSYPQCQSHISSPSAWSLMQC